MSAPDRNAQHRSEPGAADALAHHGLTDRIVRIFLDSNLSLILLVLAVALGASALMITPREEDPQIVVPLADVFVRFPGHGAAEVEQLVATPLEKLLYQIDGVEYVYGMSRPDEAVITVRFFVGEDRERSLIKLYKQINDHLDIVPPGVTGWVVKPVEIDDVPIVTLALTGKSTPADARAVRGPPAPDEYSLRRVAEELGERLAAVKNVSRVNVIGGQPRTVNLYLDPDRLQAYHVAPLDIERAVKAANVTLTAGDFSRADTLFRAEAGRALASPQELPELVIGVFGDRPVFLKDVAQVVDGPAEAVSYVRHGWGPARGFTRNPEFPGTRLNGDDAGAPAIVPGSSPAGSTDSGSKPGVQETRASQPAVTLALAKKKGSNAVWVAQDILQAAEKLEREIVPDDMQLVITRNYGLTADEKVNDLVEALAVAIFIVIALLTVGLGWREALIVAVAVPVVFGLTLTVNLLCGYAINRVTLFALILSLGLLVDDPIVDVENIARHFGLRRRASRHIVREAVAEIRPPLITATLAVIVSFLPMFFITGMMGPYMRPMALNVPVAMIMSMVVAFTITPWLTYHVLKRHYGEKGDEAARQAGNEATRQAGNEATGQPGNHAGAHADVSAEEHDLDALRKSALYRLFYPLMAPLLHSRLAAWGFLIAIGVLTVAAMGLAAIRAVPLKMLPFDNKNELLLVLDFDEGTTLERSDVAVRDFEQFLSTVPEVADFTSYVGLASPMDFNGLVRHYYLRRGENVAELRVDLAGKKNRRQQSHGIGLRLRDDLTAIAKRHGANLKIVELPPGPPVIASVVAEVYGRPDNTYADLIAAAKTVRARLEREPGVVDVDDVIEAPMSRLVFVTDKEKAALAGVTVEEIASTVRIALGGESAGLVQLAGERNPLQIELRLPRPQRSSVADLSQIHVKGRTGDLVPLAELGHWDGGAGVGGVGVPPAIRVDQTIYHKNLERVVYVFAETAGRPPADCVVDTQADRALPGSTRSEQIYEPPAGASGWIDAPEISDNPDFFGLGQVIHGDVRPIHSRTFLTNGGGLRWYVPDGIRVDFAGEGEWKITLDVFRDLGLAFGAALVAIYILLVAQTRSFAVPVIVMLAIPLTVLGVMPGFWLLNEVAGQQVGQYADPVFFTATGMIGMIALAGIVTRDSIILVDFIHLSLRRGRSLFDAIMESRVVRLRPILLTAGAAMLGAAPITIDPIFSGLAWSLIFGLLASTVFTLFVIPITYWLLYANKPGHGLPMVEA